MKDGLPNLMDKAEIGLFKASIPRTNFRIEISWKTIKKGDFYLAVRYQNSKNKAVNISDA